MSFGVRSKNNNSKILQYLNDPVYIAVKLNNTFGVRSKNSEILQYSNDPVYNAVKLNNTDIASLEDVENGDILIWDDSQKKWVSESQISYIEKSYIEKSISNINILSNNTQLKQTINFTQQNNVLKTSNVTVNLDNFTNNKQIYTFGKQIPNNWVAVGNGDNTIAYSSDGITWTGLGNSIFSDTGRGVAWNGTMWVAVGEGTNTIAYSYDGITWTEVSGSTSIFSTNGCGVAWNGKFWIAVGQGINSIAYSYDGITWTGVSESISIFSNSGYGIAGNPGIGPTIVDSQLVLNKNGFGLNSSLDLVSDTYYDKSFTNFSATFKVTSE